MLNYELKKSAIAKGKTYFNINQIVLARNILNPFLNTKSLEKPPLSINFCKIIDSLIKK